MKLSAVLVLFCLLFIGAAVFFRLRRKKNSVRRPMPLLTDWDRRCMAHHEAGHAVCSFFLPEREKLLRITIDPCSEAFGMMQTLPRLHHNETKISLSGRAATLMAGRLSEEIFLGVTSTSCLHDLSAARSIASDMVIKFGMGEKLGLAVLQDSDVLKISECHRRQISDDTLQILRKAESDARKILTEHSSMVLALAEELLSRNTLEGDELSAFLNRYAGERK